MRSAVDLSCPVHKKKLEAVEESYCCEAGCVYPSVNGIPRFVSSSNYASSFGLQWNEYRTTQLDSRTGLSISRDRLVRLMGGSLDVVKGGNVLEAGCGAGRFTEILLAWGARVCAADLSTAVDANYRNCGRYQDYFVCQANILELPFEPQQFDIVVCVGVIQHTPDPEETMAALCGQVKPGGMLVMDHYTYGYPLPFVGRILRGMLIHLPRTFSLRFCKILTSGLWPLHRLFWRLRRLPLVSRMRSLFLKISPVVDYHDAYPQLGRSLLKAWATLDTHDTLTDFYKHLRSAEEVEQTLKDNGMVEIRTAYAGNGVEARARKPLRS